MRCAWQSYLKLLPPWLRAQVDELGKEDLQELRLRIGQAPALIMNSGTLLLNRMVYQDDLTYVINAATHYSPWTAQTISSGYISTTGGHRIGVCGECVVRDGRVHGIRQVTSLCVRVARDFDGIAKGTERFLGNILIVGAPGSGKTTLLRDLIRRRARMSKRPIAVVDERGEIFPTTDETNYFTNEELIDVLSFCPKSLGIDMLLRTMSPYCIAVDEVSQQEDCDALYRAGWSGTTLLATAHAANRAELFSRPVYQPIIESKLFDTLLVMQQDKSWKQERM